MQTATSERADIHQWFDRRLIALPDHEEALAKPLSYNLIFKWLCYAEENPPSVAVERLGWDLKRRCGDEWGREIFTALSEEWGDVKSIDATWASYDRPESDDDHLLVNELALLHNRNALLPLGDADNQDLIAEVDALADRFDTLRHERVKEAYEPIRSVRGTVFKGVQDEFKVLDMAQFRRDMQKGRIPMPSNIIQLPTPATTPARIRPRRIDAATLHGKPVPQREWLVPGLIPSANVTLLYGDGGTGKSLLAIQIAVAAVAGTHFFGRPVTKGRVEFCTAEDSIDEMHRRLTDVTRAAGKSLSDLEGLNITSLADEDAILAAPEDGRGGALAATALYTELDGVLAESLPSLLVLDTLADVYGGNEIVRSQVRQFISMLRRLALRYGCTILVLAHPSLSGMERGTSGSTGWSNSVRSRLYLTRVHDTDGSEPDEDARVLRVGKSNYGRTGAEIPMRWQAGAFVPLAMAAGGDPLVQRAKAERVFTDLLTKFIAQDRPVSLSTGANYAPKLFEAEARSQGVRKRELVDAMGRLLDSGRICNVPYGPPSRGTKRLALK